MIKRIASALTAILIPLLAQPLAAGPVPRVVANSESLRLQVTGAQLDRLETLDRAPVYRLELRLAERPATLAGVEVEYEVLADDGRALGGGMFTLHSGMLAPGGEALNVLTGFGGLDLGAANLLLVRLSDGGGLPPRGPRSRAGAAAAPPANPQIVDTCTTFCDKCAGNAENLCGSAGTQSYTCSCSDGSRSCSFTCRTGKPQV